MMNTTGKRTILWCGNDLNLKPTDYGFVITSNDLEIGSLRRPSRVRVDKIYTLSQSITVKTFGRVNETTFDRVCGLLRELVAKNS
jgi:mRNA interferase MazF